MRVVGFVILGLFLLCWWVWIFGTLTNWMRD